MAVTFVYLVLIRGHQFVAINLLTYAGHPENLAQNKDHPGYKCCQRNIGGEALVTKFLMENEIHWVVNFAAESHVDKSIG